MQPTAIERIQEAARSAQCKSLDQPVYLDSDIGLFRFVDPAAKRKLYLDVPVEKVVALCRRDFWSPGETWRTITSGIHGDGWTDSVFKYFESRTEEESFPAPRSLYELRVSIFGGVAECGNGNHRLVAGRAWLTAKYGDAASFKGVKARVYPIHPCMVDLLELALRERSDLMTTTIDFPEREYLRLDGNYVDLLLKTKKNPYIIYAKVGNELVPLTDSRNFFQRNFPKWFKTPIDRYHWRTTPLQVIEGMLDDSWLAPQMMSAAIWS